MRRSRRYSLLTVRLVVAISGLSGVAALLVPLTIPASSYFLLPPGETVYEAVWQASPDKAPVEAAMLADSASIAIELAGLLMFTTNIASNWAELGWYLQTKAAQFATIVWLANAARVWGWLGVSGPTFVAPFMSLDGTCILVPPDTFYHAAALYGVSIYTSYVFPAAGTGEAFRTRPAAAVAIAWFGIVMGLFPGLAPVLQPLGIGPWSFGVAMMSGLGAVGALIVSKVWRVVSSQQAPTQDKPTLAEATAELIQGVMLPCVLMAQILYGIVASVPDGCPPWARAGGPVGAPPAGVHFPQGFNASTPAELDRLVATVTIPGSFNMSAAAAFIAVAATLLVEVQARLSFLRAQDTVRGSRLLRKAVGSVSHAARGPLNSAMLCLALLRPDPSGNASEAGVRPDAPGLPTEAEGGGPQARESLVAKLRASVQRSQRHLDRLLLWEKTLEGAPHRDADAVPGAWARLDGAWCGKLRRAFGAEARACGIELALEPPPPGARDGADLAVFTDQDRLLGLSMSMLGHAFAAAATRFEHPHPRIRMSMSLAAAGNSRGPALLPAIRPEDSHAAVAGTASARAAEAGAAPAAPESATLLHRVLRLDLRYAAGPLSPSRQDIRSGAVWLPFGAAQRQLLGTPTGWGPESRSSGDGAGRSSTDSQPAHSAGRAGIPASRARQVSGPGHAGDASAPEGALLSASPLRYAHRHPTGGSSSLTRGGASGREAILDLSLPIVHAIAVDALRGSAQLRLCLLEDEPPADVTRPPSATAGAAATAAGGRGEAAHGLGRAQEVELSVALPVWCRLAADPDGAAAAMSRGGSLDMREVDVATTAPGTAAAAATASRLQGLRVAVCDDDATSRSLLLRVLGRQKVLAVEGFADGLEFVAAARAAVGSGSSTGSDEQAWTVPDVLLLDSHMPVLGGAETLAALAALRARTVDATSPRQVAEYGRLGQMTVIVVTGDDPGSVRTAFMAAGAAGVVGKPVDAVALRDLIVAARNEGGHAQATRLTSMPE